MSKSLGTHIDNNGIKYQVNSVGGIKTSIYVRWSNGVDNAVMFDMGYIPDEDNSVYSVNVICMTHCHKDHIQRILEFLAGRERITGNTSGCKIFVPNGTKNKVNKLIEGFYECDDSEYPKSWIL